MIIICLLLLLFNINTPTTPAQGPHLSFVEKRIITCSEVKTGEIVNTSIAFVNDGDEDLMITDMERTCNCTDVDFPIGPVHPGETGIIKVSVNTDGKIGNQVIVIKLFLNSDQNYSIIRLNIPVSLK